MTRARRLVRVAPGVAALARYDRRWLPRDVLSGISVAAIAFPVGLAYADLAGVPAVIGIYSAIFPLFAYARSGSSRQLIVGPDAATCLLVAASLAPLAAGAPERYLALLPVFTLMTGVVYLLAGAARLGFIAAFLSQPTLTGYVNGIALIILAGQLPKLLGYPTGAKGGRSWANIHRTEGKRRRVLRELRHQQREQRRQTGGGARLAQPVENAAAAP